MRGSTDIELMRLLHGELPADEARELRARMDRDPSLAAAYARLERAWNGLDLPPAPPAPPGFGQRILARAQGEPSGGAISWAAAPVWVRAAAAAALVLGAAMGAGVGSWTGISQSGEAHERETAAETLFTQADSESGVQSSFAESYWDALGEIDEEGL